MFGLLNASMINLHAHNKNIIAAFFIGCFFMLACENDVNEVKELGKKKPGIEEGKNIVSFLSMGGKMKAKLTAHYYSVIKETVHSNLNFLKHFLLSFTTTA
jgi:hypothetical protein